ncbi:hypothetical protein BH09ACT12_BH09ACT12_23050 [soil metagenome]
MTLEAVECSGDSMTLHCPVGNLPGHLQGAVAAWLFDHDIDPDTVALDQPIERDSMREILTWRENSDHGVVVRTRLPAVADGAVWPAPFPAQLMRKSA